MSDFWSVKILILEDDLKTLSKLLEGLANLEDRYFQDRVKVDFTPVILSESRQVENFINKGSENFDIILLDRDTKRGASFHVLDIQKFGADRIIGISSVPAYNAELRQKGVTWIIDKNYNDLDTFALKVSNLIEQIIYSKKEG